jgi:Ca-activated chloride channel homolog
MRISAHLDVDVIAVETDDQLSVLIEMTAPAAPQDAARGHRPRWRWCSTAAAR